MPKNRIAFYLIAVALVAIAVSAPAKADTVTVTMSSNPPTSGVYDGVYTSPYQATVSGIGSTNIVCDDYVDETSIGQQWTASVTYFSQLATTVGASVSSPPLFSGSSTLSQLQMYSVMAYLVEELYSLSPSQLTGNQGAEISYAIWALTDPGLLSQSGLSGIASQAQAILTSAVNAITAPSQTTATLIAEYSQFEILTPINDDPPPPGQVCPGAGSCVAQEFLVEVPEPSFLLLLALGLIGVCSFIRIKRNGASAVAV